jgi:glutamyl-tRNA synthetase
MRQSPDEDLVAALEVILPEIGPPRGIGPTLSPELRANLLAAMPGLKERAKTLVELLDSAAFLYASRPLALDEKAAGLLASGGRGRLAEVLPRLEALPDWSAHSTETAVRAYAEEANVKLGQVAQPLRAALTGRSTSPPVFDVLAVLGRDESLARLHDQAA